MISRKNVIGTELSAKLAAAMVCRSMWFEVEPQYNDVFLFTFKSEADPWVAKWLRDNEINPGEGNSDATKRTT